jgi:hypothetical protein
MPRIIRAEFLSYYNSRRNSDKLFNVFVVEDDDGSFSCIAERGRRGTRLVRDVLCDREDRYVAEGKMRQKFSLNAITAKRHTRTRRSARITASLPENTVTATREAKPPAQIRRVKQRPSAPP